MQQVTKFTGPLLSLLVFSVYVMTLFPSIGGGDSAELVSVVNNFAVAHPPGYPLYTLLAHPLTWLPFGSQAWRVNLFSALCTSLAVWFLFSGLRLWLKAYWPALVSVLLFAFSPLVWQYSIVAEVFALNMLLACALLYFLFAYLVRPRPGILYCGALVAGLGLSNHHTLILWSLPIFIWLLWRRPQIYKQPKQVFFVFICFALGLIPYLQLPVAGAEASLFSWGDTTTWEGFLKHLLRKEYGTFKLGTQTETGSLFAATGHYLLMLGHQTLWLGIPVATGGLYFLSKKDKPLLLLVSVLLFGYLVFFHKQANLDFNDPLSIEVLARFWLLPNILVFCLIGFALSQLVASRRLPILFVAAVAGQATLAFQKVTEGDPLIYKKFAVQILESMPPEALLLVRGDLYLNSLRYVQFAEGRRQDVKVIDRQQLKATWINSLIAKYYPEVKIPGRKYSPSGLRGYSLKHLVDANYDQMPVFLVGIAAGSKEDKNESWKQEYEIWPYGFVYKIRHKSEAMNLPVEIAASERQMQIIRTFTGKPPRRESWQYLIWMDYWQMQIQLGNYILEANRTRGKNRQIFEDAVRRFEYIIGNYPDHPARVYNLLGISYYWLSRENPGLKPKMRAAWQSFLKYAAKDDPHRPKVELLLQQTTTEI